MREIKFRGKRKDNMEWVNGSLTIEYDGTCHINVWNSVLLEPENGYWEMVHEAYEVISETVGQFTGLKDKNGKKIFEGDRLRGFQKEQDDREGKHGYEILDTVSWRDGGFTVFGKNMRDGYTKESGILYQFMWCNLGHFNHPNCYYQIDDIEIIGNIHDNPELLNPPK